MDESNDILFPIDLKYVIDNINLKVAKISINASAENLAIILNNCIHMIPHLSNLSNGRKKTCTFDISTKNLGDVTVMVFITENILCVGFSSGSLICLDMFAQELCERRYQRTSVQSIRILNSISINMNSEDHLVWILYDKGYLISVSIFQP